jgi:elongation factor P hydroxylase
VGSAISPAVHVCKRLEKVFQQCFAATENTRLVGGAKEPLYLPAREPNASHLLYYREDYAASALHEVAHWCIAGRARRAQVDFGYWYAPEGRNAAQQRAFESVEFKPQALEWFFSLACGRVFRVSADNFGVDGSVPDNTAFCRRVAEQARRYQQQGLPDRARVFFEQLAREFATGAACQRLDFDAAELS